MRKIIRLVVVELVFFYGKKMIFMENCIFTKNIIASILKAKEFNEYRKKVIKGREKWGIY